MLQYIKLPLASRVLVGFVFLFVSNISWSQSIDFDVFFENHSAPLWWVNLDNGDIIRANHAASEFYGYSVTELERLNINDFNTLDAEQVAAERMLARDEGRNYFIFRHQLANGSVRTVEVHTSKYSIDERGLALSAIHDISFSRDQGTGLWHYQERLEEQVAARTLQLLKRNQVVLVTLISLLISIVAFTLILMFLLKRKYRAEKASRKFKAIAEKASYGQLIASLDGIIDYCNPYYAEVHGHTRSALEGQHVSIFHSEKQLKKINSLLKTLNTEQQFTSTIVWHIKKDGTEFPMLMSGSVMLDEVGQPEYLSTTAIDLTEQYERQNNYENELVEAKKQAESASEAKSRFLANMSHEMRTPLNAIIGLSELQLSDGFSENQRTRQEQVLHSGRLLLNIVDDLLEFTHLNAGGIKLAESAFNLDDMIDNLLVLHAPPGHEKKLELIVQVDAKVPQYLIGDSVRLMQTINNLINNAIKFTEEGYIALYVSCVRNSANCTMLRFEVEDSGIGISEESQTNIFNAFNQIDSSSTRMYPGLGLGLVTSERMVKLMGGDGIKVTSKLGKGSHFRFDLAISQPPVKHDNKRATVESSSVLVISADSKIARAYEQLCLRAAAGRVIAVNPEQGLIALAKHTDLTHVIFDKDSYGEDYKSYLSQLFQQIETTSGPKIPVVLVASNQPVSGERQEYSDKLILYILKPLHTKELKALLAQRGMPDETVMLGRVNRFCGQKVLVVEDHRINQQVVKAQLEKMNLVVSLAKNGQQAVELAKNGDFAVVLMDIQMPVMDGYQATRLIREFDKELPIIALTAAAMIEDRDDALKAGMNDHLGKPFTSQDLFQHLQQWLDVEHATAPLADAHESFQNSLSRTHTFTQPKARPRVLIVDDMPANIRILADVLKQDYTVLVANSGKKAIEIARGKQPPDLILLDIMMPDIDGYDVCRALKGEMQTNRIPIIFVTALDEADEQVRGFNLGASDYITKPFNSEIVKARVRSHIELKVKTDQLETMSHIDGLTKIPNRRFFDSTLKREASRLHRAGKPLGLIMLDIDKFKPFNDNYGHGKGDDCLEKVAAAMQAALNRSTDFLARYGGEEFVAIIPEADKTGVQIVAEKLRQAVAELNYPHEYSGVADMVTVSVGCISSMVDANATQSMLKQADRALYEAKHSGRNKVVYRHSHAD